MIRMRTEKEILDALHVLQEVCVYNEGECSKCILRSCDNDCGVIINAMGDTHKKLTDWELKNYNNPRVILN